MEPISPELALIDPELAARARALLPDVDLLDQQVEGTTPSAPTPRWIRPEAFRQLAAWLVIPSVALNIALLRTDSAAESTTVTTSAASSRAARATARPPAPPLSKTKATKPKPKPKPKRAGVESALHVRTRRPRVVERVLRWPTSPRSAGYDVVVWRGHRRIADVWTAKPKITVATVACRGGKALRAGRYLWFVYPLLESSPRRFGPLAKWGQFAVGPRLRCAPPTGD